MHLRDYQQRAVDAIRTAFGQHRSVCLALQVGGGKTVIACEIMRLAIARGKRVMFVVHRVELVEQAKERLAAFGIKAGIIKAGFTERRERPVQVACVPTLVRREFPPADIVIFDEAHHGVSVSWMAVLDHYRKAGALILGITATPLRLDGKPLGAAFQTIVEPVTTRELIERGFLIEPRVFAPPSCDRTGLKVRGGDYSLPEVADRMSKLTGSITEYWGRFCRDRRTLAFAVNVEHSREIEAALAAVGARVAHIDGTSSKDERARANKMLRAGDLDVVTQCQIWNEGLDIPELSALIVARPTKSLGLHRQILGRVMRTAPGKIDAIVLDHAGNHIEHGPVTDPIEWSLDAPPKKKKDDIQPIRTCKSCFALYPANLSECPVCGAEPVAVDRATPGVDNAGELIEIDMGARHQPEDREAEYARLVRVANDRGYKLGWARAQYKATYGVWPRQVGHIERNWYTCAEHEWADVQAGPFKRVRCARCLTYQEPVAQ